MEAQENARPVLIRVKSMQEYEGAEADGTELVTDGTLARLDDGALSLRYEESALTGLEGTETAFLIQPDQVTLTRTGACNSQMIFRLGRQHLSAYDTPYGSISIQVRTHRLDQAMDETGGTLRVDYSIELDHIAAGESSFSLTVRPRPAPAGPACV